MSIIYVPQDYLSERWIVRRDALVEELCQQGLDKDTAMAAAREQTNWEFRDWKTHESQIQCESQKDYFEYIEEMSLGGRTYR